MNVINVRQEDATYELSEDFEFLCIHEDYEVEPPCCSGIDSEGNPSCGCHGQYGVLCHNLDCTGISDSEAELIIDTYVSGFGDYDD